MKFLLLLHKSIWLLVLAILWNVGCSKGTIHLFLCEDESIFSNCDHKPDALGIESIFDMSNLKVEIGEETVSIEGNFEVVWDIEPTDRVDLKAELLKSARGGWQPTVFSLVQKDLCSSLFEEDGIWYKSWGKFVDEDDRKCINHKGTIYHHVPFNLEMSVDIQGEKISGRHKVVMEVEAYDSADEKRSEVCIQILMDVITK